MFIADQDEEITGGAEVPRTQESDKDGTRLVWAAISILSLVVLGYAAWLGESVTTLQQEVAGITAKLDIVLSEHRKVDE